MSTDYSKVSDFEINKRVALASGKNIKFISVDVDDNEIGVIVGQKHTRQQLPFDPCNNPADAWPIISDNRISIMYDQSTEKGSEAQWCLASSPCDQHIVDYVSPSKLLRSAMIVFLMMQGEKNG